MATTHCPACVSDKLSWRNEVQKFLYGNSTEFVELEAVVLIGTCGHCGFEFQDYRSENSRTVAVERHLRERENK